MPRKVNRYGLPRDIPSDVRRAVRQAAGFACVGCGCVLGEYHHFDPPFKEAREHRADGIIFACGACHPQLEAGGPTAVRWAQEHPRTFANGSDRRAFFLAAPFALQIGKSRFENVNSIIKTREGERWLSVAPPEEDGGPFRISVAFFDDEGRPSLAIEENVYVVSTELWDTQIQGDTITVRKGPGDIALQLRTCQPHTLSLERLKMQRGNLGVAVEPGGRITMKTRGGGSITFDGGGAMGSDAVFLL